MRLRNSRAKITKPTTLMTFRNGSGHFTHSKLDKGWYLVPFKILQSEHKNPSYPSAHVIGYWLEGL